MKKNRFFFGSILLSLLMVVISICSAQAASIEMETLGYVVYTNNNPNQRDDYRAVVIVLLRAPNGEPIIDLGPESDTTLPPGWSIGLPWHTSPIDPYAFHVDLFENYGNGCYSIRFKLNTEKPILLRYSYLVSYQDQKYQGNALGWIVDRKDGFQ